LEDKRGFSCFNNARSLAIVSPDLVETQFKDLIN